LYELLGSPAHPDALASDPNVATFATDACEEICAIAGLDGAAVAVARPGANSQLIGMSAANPAVGLALADVLDDDQLVAEAVAHQQTTEAQDGTIFIVPGLIDGQHVVFVGRRAADSWPYDACLRQVLGGAVRMAAHALEQQVSACKAQRVAVARASTDLARSVHEDVVQRLFGVTLVLSDEAPLDPELRGLCATEVEQALGDLRGILQRSVTATPRAMPARCVLMCLDDLAAEGVEVVVGRDVDLDDVSDAQRAVLVSVVSEAVRNARKHARPTRVDVSIVASSGRLTLAVRNDGVGGRVARAATGVGLRLAEAEAAAAGGALEHGPDGNGRWAVRLTLFLEERDERSSRNGRTGSAPAR
jgi:signal transduction histidine kinase